MMPQSTTKSAPTPSQVSPQSILDAPVNLFHGVLNTTPVKVFTLAEALELIQNGTYRQEVQRLQSLLATQGEKAYKAAKTQLDAVTFCGTFSTRHKDSLTQHSGIVHGDIDHLVDVQAVKAQLSADRHTVYCFASPSGSGLKVGLSVAIVGDDPMYKLTWQAAANYHHSQYGIWWDTSGKDVSRLCFLSDDPDVYVNPDPVRFVVPATTPASAPPPQYRPVLPTLTLDDSSLLDKARHAADGPKFIALFDAGDSSSYPSQSEADIALCNLLVFWTQHDAARVDGLFRQSALYTTIDRKGNPEDYLARTINNAMATVTNNYTPAGQLHVSASNGSTAPGSTPAAEPSLGWNDYVNARCLVREHGAMLRYCYPWKRWLVWTGSHWQHDNSGEVMRRAKQTIKKLAEKVPQLPDAEAKALLQHIKTSLATIKLKAMVESAQSEPGIAVQPEALDTHGWLLNCANGTLNLQNGQLQPHLQADLLTKCLSIPYEPAALCPTWERFLWRIMGGTVTPDDPDMSVAELDARQKADDRAQRFTTFWQRLIGYSLTGSTREQSLFVLHGSGANGKSTLLELLQVLLGDYAQSTPSASLLAKERHDGIPNDIARLRGARLVTAVEIGEGKRLNEELVKRLTGQDTLTGRFLHAEFFDFTAEFKLCIACNHLPQIRGMDLAIWRRVKRIPFDVTIPEEDKNNPALQQDKELSAKLRAELPGILAWAVRGCLAWQKDGLQTPDEVTAATSNYRASMDVIGRFIEEGCLVSPQVRVKASDLYDAYKKWCEDSNEYAVTKKAFGTSLDERSFATHTSNGVWRLGIGLR